MQYVVDFELMEAFLDVCIEARTPEEAKQEARKLVSSKEFCGEDNKYPPGMEDWNCNLYTYAEYAGYPWSLPIAAFEFQGSHLVQSFKGTEVVAESPAKAAEIAASSESGDAYLRNGVSTVLVVGSRLDMFEVCRGVASRSFGGGA